MNLQARFERDLQEKSSQVDTEYFTGKRNGEYFSPATQDLWKGYQSGHAAAAAEIAELRAKVEAAEKDAARYRAIRGQTFDIRPMAWLAGDALDAAIDEARKK